MINTNGMPTLLTLYNSMTKSGKVAFRKSYMTEFDASSQTFDRRKFSNFNTFSNAEKKWASGFLNIPLDELFVSEMVNK